jgi:alkanesulfonate monooxygenase
MDSKRKNLEVFSTCPRSDTPGAGSDYLRNVEDIARWSEENGCKGILVYSDNSMLDPWVVSQRILETTEALCPLVAVQPIYMHPYAAAKMVATFGHLYQRQIYLNMIAGGFKNDLVALSDTTPHDKRYTRLTEYTLLILQLLKSRGLVSFEGEFYKVDKLKMTPTLPPELLPGVFISGSSEAGLQAARSIGATAVQYPKPPGEIATEPPPDGIDCGIRVGIIARADEDEAWEIAEQRFPEDRKGELTHQLAMKVSDSLWHKQLSVTAEKSREDRSPYWLRPFETYKTFCPYLVGSYDRVAQELARYVELRYETFILDIPPNQEELQHAGIVFEKTAMIAQRGNLNAK